MVNKPIMGGEREVISTDVHSVHRGAKPGEWLGYILQSENGEEGDE